MSGAEPGPAPALLVVGDGTLPERERVWGTGGWLPPEQREALDWLTLLRLCGWGTAVAPAEGPLPDEAGTRWIVVAGDPDALPEPTARLLEARLAASPALVVMRAPRPGGALARLAGAAAGGAVEGRALRWTGPGGERGWRARTPLPAQALALAGDAAPWATLDGAPLIAARRVGRGTVATLAFHPSAARDADGAATALLRHLLVFGVEGPVAWLDFEGCLVLRMDDPGGAQNVHSRGWSHAKLGEAEWAALGADLARRRGRISLAYVSGWVDDGDAGRGALTVGGAPVPRVAGAVHPSPLVRWVDCAGHAPGAVHDYAAEYRGIQALRAAGLADVELHGHTHLHPDPDAWARAADRYEAVGWYRELGEAGAAAIAARPRERHPLTLGCEEMGRHFGVRPTTLVSPGDAWTTAVLEHALGLGLELVDSYYLALRHDGRWCWAQHVCAPYLDRPAPDWFDAGLPVVGYFHDRDVACEGVGWVSRLLDGWQAAGARRLVDFRELAAALDGTLTADGGAGAERVTVATGGGPAPVRPVPVLFRAAAGGPPARVAVERDGVRTTVAVADLGGGVGRLLLP